MDRKIKIDFQIENAHAKWIPTKRDDGWGEYEIFTCSNCGGLSARNVWNFYRECGARMETAPLDERELTEEEYNRLQKFEE